MVLSDCADTASHVADAISVVIKSDYASRSRTGDRWLAAMGTTTIYVIVLFGLLMHRSPPDHRRASPARPLTVMLLPLPEPQPHAAPSPPRRPPSKTISPEPHPSPLRVPQQMIAPPIVMPAATPTTTVLTPQPAPASPPAVAPSAPPPATSAMTAAAGRGTWEARVLAQLERYKRFPSVARSRREQGVATIRFRVDRNGRVLSSELVTSAGSASLDSEALALVSRAQPLPAIPRDRPSEIELIVPIEFFLRTIR